MNCSLNREVNESFLEGIDPVFQHLLELSVKEKKLLDLFSIVGVPIVDRSYTSFRSTPDVNRP